MSKSSGTKFELNLQQFFHGTKAQLKTGDLIEAGYNSNYDKSRKALFVYLTATIEAAIWGAELALGNEAERIYIVEPKGSIEDDPNLTNKKYPGNPTKSYRTRDPLLIVGEVNDWQGHSQEQLKEMKDNIARVKELGIGIIED